MKNLAGVSTCDITIREELTEAGVEIIEIAKGNTEVPYTVIGKLNGFLFQRGWYYWVVSGLMPLQYAKEMYYKHKDLSIRVSGHCGNPPPEEWCQPKDYQEMCKPVVEKYYSQEMTTEDCDAICNEIRKRGKQYITHYHIDTQEGLNEFARIVKENNVTG